MNKHIICSVAGKSGGHIIPCLTIAQHNNPHNTQPLLLFFSSNTPLDKTILSHHKAVTWHIALPLSTRAGSYIKTLFNAFSSFIISFFYLCKHRPEKIITTGGIVAIPTCIAGFILRIPIVIYSLDAAPGKAIKALTPLAQSIVTCFASAQHYFPAHKCSVAPYPIKYKSTDNKIDQHYAQESLGLSPNKKTILILGGSQGSLFLNECMKQWIADPSFDTDALQIIHQTGSTDSTDWQALYASHNTIAHVFSYYPDLALMYAAADLIVCRAGAGTLFEIKFFNKPCIIIPLSTNTTDHQVDNARAMANEYPELFCAIAQNDVEKDPNVLFTRISDIL
jgi:UDP-N-acetylglucosamine--N-acetylmuramyl-(pentapeptide) pyrophosphoryl-undecaprenol N-acetylglucosamine transferase